MWDQRTKVRGKKISRQTRKEEYKTNNIRTHKPLRENPSAHAPHRKLWFLYAALQDAFWLRVAGSVSDAIVNLSMSAGLGAPLQAAPNTHLSKSRAALEHRDQPKRDRTPAVSIGPLQYPLR